MLQEPLNNQTAHINKVMGPEILTGLVAWSGWQTPPLADV